jgi:hypothetical protein
VTVFRSAITVALAAAVILLGVALAPVPAAMAGSGFISVVGNATSPADNPGLLSVGLQASSPITSVTVQVAFGSASFADSGLQLTSGTTTSGTWTVPAPITMTELPLGQYYVDVSATDSAGDSISGVQVSQWNFNMQPTVTLTATPDQISANGQTITLSGTATGVYPDSTAPKSQPLAGQPVTVTTSGEIFGDGNSWPLTTAADGSFSLTTATGLSSTDETDTFQATIVQSDTTAFASATVSILPIKAAVRVTATITPSHPLYGQAPTITGTVTIKAGGTWQPLPSSPVYVTDQDNSLQATAGPSGQFSIQLPPVYGPDGGPWQVEAGDLNDAGDPFAGTATMSVPANGPVDPGTLSAFTASISKFGVVSVTGCLEDTSRSGAGVAPGVPVTIQYATSKGGPWQALGTVTTTSTTCGSNSLGGYFSGSLPAMQASAYYQAAMTTDQYDYVPTTSTAVLVSITPTRFVSFDATPHTVRRNGKITISGGLELLGKSWQSYPGQSVDIIFRPRGSKFWYVAYWVKTNSSGRFSRTFRDKFGTATWSADYNGNSTHLVAGAATVRVRVT